MFKFFFFPPHDCPSESDAFVYNFQAIKFYSQKLLIQGLHFIMGVTNISGTDLNIVFFFVVFKEAKGFIGVVVS